MLQNSILMRDNPENPTVNQMEKEASGRVSRMMVKRIRPRGHRWKHRRKDAAGCRGQQTGERRAQPIRDPEVMDSTAVENIEDNSRMRFIRANCTE